MQLVSNSIQSLIYSSKWTAVIQWDLFGSWMLHVQASCGDYSMQCDCKFCVLYAGCPNNNACMRPSMDFVLTVHIPGTRAHLLTNFPCLWYTDTVSMFYWEKCV